MDTLLYGLRSALDSGVALLTDTLPPLWGLVLLSLLTGVFMLWVVGRTTPQRRVELARARMASAIYETRLYLDSPRRIFAAQGRLLLWSFAYVAFMLPAFILLSLPIWLLYLHLDTRHGVEPLPLDTPIPVRIVLASDDGADLAPGDLRVESTTPDLELTAPPLTVPDEGLVYLRVAISKPGAHVLTLRAGDAVVTKRLQAGGGDTDAGPTVAWPERTRGLALLSSMGAEPPIPAGSGIASISVVHPPASDPWLGLSMRWWWLHALVLATVAALAMRRPLGVTM